MAVRGTFTWRRALAVGFLIGLSFAVSMKTVVLVAALCIAALFALVLACVNRQRFNAAHVILRVLAMAVAAVIPPAAVVYYFFRQGAYQIMYYCVILHNVLPRLKRWGHFDANQWYFPTALVLLAVYGWLIFRQERPASDKGLALRRTIVTLMPWIYLSLLWSYWPDITREDNLPYTPLVPLSMIPLASLARGYFNKRRVLTYALPALGLLNIAYTAKYQNIREDRLRVTTHSIADILQITQPADFVMDDKGDYVFRRRAYYWVLEAISMARLRMGLESKDNIAPAPRGEGSEDLFTSTAPTPAPSPRSLLSAITSPLTHGSLLWTSACSARRSTPAARSPSPHPLQTYSLFTENGQLAGELDGKPYTGPMAGG